jgi:hypothetical protein
VWGGLICEKAKLRGVASFKIEGSTSIETRYGATGEGVRGLPTSIGPGWHGAPCRYMAKVGKEQSGWAVPHPATPPPPSQPPGRVDLQRQKRGKLRPEANHRADVALALDMV